MSNYWKQKAVEAGHTAHLISAELVSSIRQNQKTDKNDALAIVQASLLPDISFIKEKMRQRALGWPLFNTRPGKGKTWLNRKVREEQFVAKPTDNRSHGSGSSGLQTNSRHQERPLDTRAGRTPRQKGYGSRFGQQNSEDGIFYAHSRYWIQGGASSRLKSVPTMEMHKRRLKVSVLTQFNAKSLELVKKIWKHVPCKYQRAWVRYSIESSYISTHLFLNLSHFCCWHRGRWYGCLHLLRT